jgi:pimeloyl-ACP methyl ester carboxylesterase
MSGRSGDGIPSSTPNGILLAVRDYGGTRHAPLILLHGSGDTLATRDELAPLLAPIAANPGRPLDGQRGGLAVRGRRNVRARRHLDRRRVCTRWVRPAAVRTHPATRSCVRPRSAGPGANGSSSGAANRSPKAPPARVFHRAHRRRPDGCFERRPSAEVVRAMSRGAASVERRLTSDDLYASIGCPVLLVCGEHAGCTASR